MDKPHKNWLKQKEKIIRRIQVSLEDPKDRVHTWGSQRAGTGNWKVFRRKAFSVSSFLSLLLSLFLSVSPSFFSPSSSLQCIFSFYFSPGICSIFSLSRPHFSFLLPYGHNIVYFVLTLFQFKYSKAAS